MLLYLKLKAWNWSMNTLTIGRCKSLEPNNLPISRCTDANYRPHGTENPRELYQRKITAGRFLNTDDQLLLNHSVWSVQRLGPMKPNHSSQASSQ